MEYKQHPSTRMVAEGSFGCVFQPALLCTEDDQGKEFNARFANNKLYVMKFMNRDHAKKELAIAEKLCKIPNADAYFTFLLGPSCKIQKLFVTCDAYEASKEKDKFRGFALKYGGKALEDVWPRLPKSDRCLKMFLTFALHFCKALAILHDASIVHFDLKADNMLIAPSTGSVGTMIDFGMSLSLTDSRVQVVDAVRSRRGYIYTAYPPDFSTCGHSPSEIRKFYTNHSKTDVELYLKSQEVWSKQLNELFADFERLSHYLTKLDIYSLGVVFQWMLTTISDSNASPHKQHIYNQLTFIIDKQMICLDSDKRPTAADLHKELSRIWNELLIY